MTGVGMKLAKSIVTVLLLLFVVATVGTLIAQEVARPKAQLAEASEATASETANNQPATVLNEPAAVDEAEPSEIDVADEAGDDEGTVETAILLSPSEDTSCVIEAVYFHNTNRCVTCLNIESGARAIVEAEFAEEIAAGKLRWSAINMEDERSYISLYDLASPSLVLICKIGDEVVDWITLADTWSMIRSSTRFRSYIMDSFQTFLEGCP